MAVIQISKIQVRRGLQENLPQLSSGEMGWSVDEQRLWIGNGSLTEGAPAIGNTEILTSNSDVLNAIESYTFKGQESGYTSMTGPTKTAAVTRSLQNKFDEQISLRDFVTAADTASGDYTVAIQRALDQVFPASHITNSKVRRALHIPAGTWNISANILIPPYATIVGDGINSTIINKTAGTDTVIRFKDSRGQVGTSVNIITSVAPTEISISGLTLTTEVDTDIALLDNCSNVDFTEVAFSGAASTVLVTGDDTSGVVSDYAITDVTNITFNRCRFDNTTYGLTLTTNTYNVTVNTSTFSTLYNGIYVDDAAGVRVIASYFSDVAQEAIVSALDGSIVSAYNYFDLVGRGDASFMDSGSPTTSVLTWNTANNYSVNDLFTRTEEEARSTPLTQVGTGTSTLVQKTTAGSVTDTPGFTEVLTDNTSASANTALVIGSTTTNIVDYSITRGTTYRVGSIKVTQNSGTAIYEDDYSETASTGVTLGFTGYGSDVTLTYTSTSTGDDATLKYTVRSFI